MDGNERPQPHYMPAASDGVAAGTTVRAVVVGDGEKRRAIGELQLPPGQGSIGSVKPINIVKVERAQDSIEEFWSFPGRLEDQVAVVRQRRDMVHQKCLRLCDRYRSASSPKQEHHLMRLFAKSALVQQKLEKEEDIEAGLIRGIPRWMQWCVE